MCGRVSVVDEDLLAPRHGLQRLDAETRQPEHRVLHPPETAVGLETVVGLQIFFVSGSNIFVRCHPRPCERGRLSSPRSACSWRGCRWSGCGGRGSSPGRSCSLPSCHHVIMLSAIMSVIRTRQHCLHIHLHLHACRTITADRGE